MVTDSPNPAEYLRGTSAAVFPVPLSPAPLGLVVLQPAVGLFDQLLPAVCSCEVKVRHPALNIEGRLAVPLRGFPRIYLFLAGPQSLVDRPRWPGAEDASAVRDDS